MLRILLCSDGSNPLKLRESRIKQLIHSRKFLLTSAGQGRIDYRTLDRLKSISIPRNKNFVLDFSMHHGNLSVRMNNKILFKSKDSEYKNVRPRIITLNSTLIVESVDTYGVPESEWIAEKDR